MTFLVCEYSYSNFCWFNYVKWSILISKSTSFFYKIGYMDQIRSWFSIVGTCIKFKDRLFTFKIKIPLVGWPVLGLSLPQIKLSFIWSTLLTNSSVGPFHTWPHHLWRGYIIFFYNESYLNFLSNNYIPNPFLSCVTIHSS